MSGITRIKIISSWNDWRIQLEEAHYEIANKIYRNLMTSIGIPLASGDETINVTKEEAVARYDWKEGIDVLLESSSGHRMTMQAKFLTFYNSTVTFEETKSSGKPGAWYYCTAQYYFVGYTRKYWNYKTRKVVDNPTIDFQDWVMVDFPALRRADATGNIHWEFNKNQHDNRAAEFRFITFDNIPETCIVGRYHSPSATPQRLPAPPPDSTSRNQYEKTIRETLGAAYRKYNE